MVNYLLFSHRETFVIECIKPLSNRHDKLLNRMSLKLAVTDTLQ